MKSVSYLAHSSPTLAGRVGSMHQYSILPKILVCRTKTEASALPPLQRPSSSLRVASFATEAESMAEQPSSSGNESMEEYANAKKLLLARAKRAGGFLAAYLFLSQSGQAALCALTGSAAGYIYLLLLIRDVDNITPDTWLPYQSAQEITQQPLRALAQGLAAYRQALQPRLLIPILLAAAVGAYNRHSQQPLSGLQEFEVLLGFLTYKAGLFLTLWDDSKPKFDQGLRAPRPQIPDLPDVQAKDLPESQEHRRF